jgi:hypothetical protein
VSNITTTTKSLFPLNGAGGNNKDIDENGNQGKCNCIEGN